MDFTQAVRTCIGKYATFSGRAGRAEFWFFQLFFVLFMLVGDLLDEVTGSQVASVLLSLAFVLPQLSAASRRLHDLGRSAAWLLVLLIPFFGLLALAVICAGAGEPYPNRHGAPVA